MGMQPHGRRSALGLVSRSPDRRLVIVAEHDATKATIVAETLKEMDTLESEKVASGDQVLLLLARRTPDLLIVNDLLPVLSGFELCRVVRNRPTLARLPVLMIVSSAEESHRLAALEAGADECILASTTPRGLRWRIEQLIGHLPAPGAPSAWMYRGRHLTADFSEFSVRVDGQLVRLSRMELQLLRFLIRNAHRAVSREVLAESVWGHQRSIHSRSLDVHIARLRSKLGSVGKQIETVVGVGYRFIADS